MTKFLTDGKRVLNLSAMEYCECTDEFNTFRAVMNDGREFEICCGKANWECFISEEILPFLRGNESVYDFSKNNLSVQTEKYGPGISEPKLRAAQREHAAAKRERQRATEELNAALRAAGICTDAGGDDETAYRKYAAGVLGKHFTGSPDAAIAELDQLHGD